MNSSQEEEEAGHPRGGSTSKKPTDVTVLDFSPQLAGRKFRRRWRSIQETKCNPLWKLVVVHAFHETGRGMSRGGRARGTTRASSRGRATRRKGSLREEEEGKKIGSRGNGGKRARREEDELEERREKKRKEYGQI